MGPSGCGKTTLLNVLAGRLHQSTGDVHMNQMPIDNKFRHVSGYVTQDDTFLPHLTVREQLVYSAMLRLPQSMSKTEKMAKVIEVERDLGLSGCSNTKIGNTLVRGVSGGERKRANIGVELLSDPKILFLDEPTSGLDAFTAKALMDTLRSLADAGCAVVISIHQPRADIFAMFDNLLLMSVEEVVYFGPGSQASTDYFTEHNVKFPKFANPADHLMDIVTIENAVRQSGAVEKDSLVSNLIQEYKQTELSKTENFPPAPPPLPPVSKKQRASSRQQFFLLFGRSVKNVYRNPLATIARVIQAIVLGIIVGWVFFHIGMGQNSTQDKTGGIFLLTMGQSFPVATAVIALFIIERDVYFREHKSGMYRTSTYYFSKIISEFPMTIISTSIQGLITYWMMGLNGTAGRFFTFILLMCLIALITSAIGILVSAFAPNINVANILVPVILVTFIIFSGFLRNSNQYPKFWIWMEYLSFFRYAYQALVCNEFVGTHLTCTPDQEISGVCPIQTGDFYVHDIMGFNCEKKWPYVGVLITFWIGYILLGYTALRWKSRKH
eukprot:Phypoly_transcript_05129.p1 GENE.Phypoly_transcript_05129~~Phypoly_transcript_05129.p1  ORF type:complete len:566 (+),score=66.71 Phypoly_transcript_05129:42-1700(+)